MDSRLCCTIFFQTSAFNSEINQKTLWLGVGAWRCGQLDVELAKCSSSRHPNRPDFSAVVSNWFGIHILKKKRDKYRVSEHGERVKSQETGSVIWWLAKQNTGISQKPRGACWRDCSLLQSLIAINGKIWMDKAVLYLANVTLVDGFVTMLGGVLRFSFNHLDFWWISLT